MAVPAISALRKPGSSPEERNCGIAGIALSPYRRIGLSPCRPVALSPCRPVALSPYRPIALSPFRRIGLSPCRPIALSPCRPIALSALPALVALFLPVLIFRILDKTRNYCGYRPSPPGNSVSDLGANRPEPNETDTRCRQPADMFCKNGDTESRGNILDTGARPIYFLHNSGRKTCPVKQSGQPSPVIRRILAGREDKWLIPKLRERDPIQLCDRMIVRNSNHRVFFGDTFQSKAKRRFSLDRANQSNIQTSREERLHLLRRHHLR
jgi:hypothetical protein